MIKANKPENVYHIRMKENLSFILPVVVRNNRHTIIKKGEMAVFVHLYYWDTVDHYFEYIRKIPNVIDIYISVSVESMRKSVEEKAIAYGLDYCKVIGKENRGRDISALLVAYREIMQKYEYACFLHDKKAKGNGDFLFKKNWIVSMWENMVCTEDYIYNVRDIFDGYPELGILAVPEPFDEKVNTAFDNSWGKNFALTVKLAKQLNLNCRMDEQIPPITLGTIFWCRTSALKKLLDYPWKYEDFPEEPVPNDGTINHAVERIFAYVAQDAGYKTGTVRTVPCAERQILFMQDALRISFFHMEKLGIGNFNTAVHYEKRKEECRAFFQKFDDVYLYGAGVYGRKSLQLLDTMGLRPKGFIVSHKGTDCPEVNGFQVWDLEEVELNERTGVIIAVSITHIDAVIEALRKKVFQNYMWIMDD